MVPATKRKFTNDGEEGGGKLIRIEGSIDRSFNSTSQCANMVPSVSLRNVTPLATTAIDCSLGDGISSRGATEPHTAVASKENPENKKSISEEVPREQISIQLEAKQATSVSLDTVKKVLAKSHPRNELDENKTSVPQKVHKRSQPQSTREKEDDESSSSSSSSSSSASKSSFEYSEESSLLSSWSEESSKEGIEPLPSLWVKPKYVGLERLKRKLEQRKKRLKRLCVDRPPAYVHLLEQNEKVAGEIKIAEYLKENPDEARNLNGHANETVSSSSAKSTSSNDKTRSKWRGIVQFEWMHTLPNAYVLIVMMSVHTAFYGVSECLCRIIYESFFQRWNVGKTSFYIGLMVLGLALLRFNGGIFYYSRTFRDHSRVKMEMSNRLRIGMFDARIFKRIKGNLIGSTFNMIGYYLICIGIGFFNMKLYWSWIGSFENWINNIWTAAVNLANEEIREKQEEWAHFYEVVDPGGVGLKVSPTCIVASDQVSHWFIKPFWVFWCRDPTYEYKSVELTYHCLSLLVVAVLSYRFGHNVMKACD